MRSSYLDLLAKYGISGAHPGGMSLTKRVLDSLGISRDTKLIDLGCGTGHTLRYVAGTYGCKVTGVDINEQMLSKAAAILKAEKPAVELVRADILRLPFPPASFDIALSESVTIFTEIRAALKESRRVLKSGGTLVMIEMTAASPLEANELMEIKSVYGIRQVPTKEEWENMLRKAGFPQIHSFESSMTSLMFFTSPKMYYDFYPHLYTMNHLGRKLRCGVYICQSAGV